MDVEPLENVIQYLNNLPDFADTVPTSAIPVKTPWAKRILSPRCGPGSPGPRRGVPAAAGGPASAERWDGPTVRWLLRLTAFSAQRRRTDA